jgi:hypothetical protein
VFAETNPAGRQDPVEGAAVDDEVLDDRERVGAEGLDRDHVAVGEAAHVQLAGRRLAIRPVRAAVDHEAARAADPFAAVVVEGHGVSTLREQALVQDVEHLEEDMSGETSFIR